MMTPSANARGFTLIELVVAFVMLVMAMTVIYSIFSGGVRRLAQVNEYSHAMLLAESQLAMVGITEPLVVGEQEGRFDDKYHWRLVTSLVEEAQLQAPSAAPLELYRLTLIVRWRSADRSPELSLTTLRLQDAEESGR